MRGTRTTTDWEARNVVSSRDHPTTSYRLPPNHPTTPTHPPSHPLTSSIRPNYPPTIAQPPTLYPLELALYAIHHSMLSTLPPLPALDVHDVTPTPRSLRSTRYPHSTLTTLSPTIAPRSPLATYPLHSALYSPTINSSDHRHSYTRADSFLTFIASSPLAGYLKCSSTFEIVKGTPCKVYTRTFCIPLCVSIVKYQT